MTSFYQATAEKYIEIDGEGNDLVCTIPSERNTSKRYELKCVEHHDSVEVVSCDCLGYKRHGHCKHVDIVSAFWIRIYKSNAEKIAARVEQEAKAAEVAQVVEVSPVAEVAIVETPEIVEQVEEVVPPIAMDLPDELKGYRKKAVSVDISTKGNLNGNSGFSVLRKVG